MIISYPLRRKIISVVRTLKLMPMVNALNNARFFVLKKYYLWRGKNPLERIYNDTFFNIADTKYTLGTTPAIVARVIDHLYHPKSVVDIGCGCGFYLHALEKRGIDVCGIDGSSAARRNLVIHPDTFLLRDVTKVFSLPRRYDCALCFEVAEHIPTDKSEVLVDNIVSLSDTVFFTAAPKGQGGHDHINEQEPQFWVRLFEQKRYQFLEEETQEIKKMLTEQNAVFWLRENLLVFQKK